ncbi:MAG: glycosyltransferase [Candidatus Riflebacteria bacterium]|nr:glycosyltransferase [Candidatus Riflebacteria bacterium]
MKKAKIVHLTSAHTRYDIRIFLKICCSLANAGYDINLVVADGKGYEEKNSVKIYDVGKPLRRIERMLKSSLLVYKRALLLNGDIYHIHDPELLPYAYLLKLKGKKVIFDSHEDTPRQILTKPYLLFRHCEALKEPWQSRNLHSFYIDVINKNFLKSISFIYEKVEKFICSRLNCVVTATPFIRDIFSKYNSNSIDINNFPMLGELENSEKTDKKNQICYVGGIKPIRGIFEIIEAMKYVKNDIKLCIAGNYLDEITSEELLKREGSEKIELNGFLNRIEVKKLLGESIAGIVTFLPLSNHINAQPNKMFEYMSASLPVIASDFPLWKEIIERNKCGICVNPQDPKKIAESIDYLFEHQKEAAEMGKNGRNAVYEKYNWANEEKKLLKLYDSLL